MYNSSFLSHFLFSNIFILNFNNYLSFSGIIKLKLHHFLPFSLYIIYMPGGTDEKASDIWSIALLLVFNYSVAYAKPTAANADSYILIDSETGGVLCEKIRRIAISRQHDKILTAVLALEMGDLSQVYDCKPISR